MAKPSERSGKGQAGFLFVRADVKVDGCLNKSAHDDASLPRLHRSATLPAWSLRLWRSVILSAFVVDIVGVALGFTEVCLPKASPLLDLEEILLLTC